MLTIYLLNVDPLNLDDISWYPIGTILIKPWIPKLVAQLQRISEFENQRNPSYRSQKDVFQLRLLPGTKEQPSPGHSKPQQNWTVKSY